MKYIQLLILILGILTVSAQTNYTNYNQSSNYSTTQSTNQTNYNQSSNYSTTQTYPQYIYNNQSDTINNTNNTYQTSLQNQTYNYSNLLNDTRPKIQESKIHLKLRKQLNLNQKYNHTQNVTFYNQTQQQYQTIVLFNETKTKNKQTPNQYYYYQNTTLITLTKEYNTFGNVVYRTIDYNFSLVIEGNSTDGTSTKNSNYALQGTIVQDENDLSGNHQSYGQTDENINNGKENTQQNAQSSSYGNFNYANGYGSFDENKLSNSQESTSSNQNKNFNDKIYYQENSQGNSNKRNESQFQGHFDINGNQKFSPSKGKSQSESDSYSNDQVLTFGNASIEKQKSNNGNKTQGKSIREQSNQGYDDTPSQISWSDIFNNNSDITVNYDNKYVTKQEMQNGDTEISYQFGGNQYGGTKNLNVDKTIDSNIYHENSTTKGQGQNYQTVSDNYVRDIDNYENQQFKLGGNHSISASGTGNLGYAKNQTHSVSNSVNGTTTTVVNLNGTTSDTRGSYYGGVPEVNQTGSKINMGYTDVTQTQQFASLRGARKSTGSWKQVEVEELISSNSLIPEEAIQAVNQQFNPEQEGYYFDQILNVHEQIVSGFNYQIKLQYNNQDGDTRIYQVIIYSIPWTNQPDQIISCQRLGN